MTLLAGGGLFGGTALAQENLRNLSIDKLPRPGYEARQIKLGQAMLSPALEIGAIYDDNLFATPSNKKDDIFFSIQPSLTLLRDASKSDIQASLFGDIRRYTKFTNENVETFGAKANASFAPDGRNSFTASARLERTFEPRSDPEAINDPSRPPAKINVAAGGLGYSYKGNRFGIGVNANVTRYNYLPRIDDDRDLTDYYGSLRGSLKLSSRFDLFVQPYVNYRDARTAVDRSGFNRDATTYGALGGIAVTLGDTLTGEVGVGAFRSNPKDPALRSFSGLGASGRLSWRPRVRTAITAQVYRGDVATIRSGAVGRIDTNFTLSADQEVRHNFLLHADVGMRKTSYKGSSSGDLTSYSAGISGRYLLSRGISLTAGVEYTKRTAASPPNAFNRLRVMVGTRFTY